MTSKKDLSERDICTQFIIPALVKSKWDLEKQIREEVFFTDGCVFVKGNKSVRGKRKRADIILYMKPNIPVAVIEAKDNNHPVNSGIQQALGYAETLDIPVAFSSNGDGFIQHDRSGFSTEIEKELSLDEFPSPGNYGKCIKNTSILRQLKKKISLRMITFSMAPDAPPVTTSKSQ